jgi:hypothetical protein
MTMKQSLIGTTLGLVGGMLLAACAAEYSDPAEYEEAATDALYGAAQEAVGACAGDSLQYDFNAFAASLAVAIANELKHWDATTDFVVSNGRLALSSTGSAACGMGCANVKDLLLLQEDVTGTIPNHSPLEYRNHLVSWYNAEKARLTDLAIESKLPPGSYQLENRYSSKYMVVDAASITDGASIEQNALNGDASNWTMSVVGGKHKVRNIRSGKCLDLASASSADWVYIVQRTCSTTSTQNFDVVKEDGGYYSLKTVYGKQIVSENWGTGNDVKLIQVGYQTSNANGNWKLRPVNGTANPATTIFKGMYALSFATPGTGMVAAPISSAEGAQVKLASYSASNMLHNWYAATVNGRYQFINRGSGKCLALASDSPTALLVQKTCAVNDSQLFTATALTYAEQYSLKTRYGTLLEAQNAGTTAGTPLAQVSATQPDPQRRIRFSPMQAAEPHKLTFNHVSAGAPCGNYFWYDITQPSGAAVSDPMATYIDLIFAGGKTQYSGADANPFIAQLSSGSQVAIDPSGYLLAGSTSTSGSCIQSDILVDLTKAIGGHCCTKYTGVQAAFAASTWSSTTFLCR